MVEDLRNHDPEPTEEERGLMDLNPVSTVVGLMLAAILALAIGVSASTLDAPQKPAKTAAAR
jgi:hypothetical protein